MKTEIIAILDRSGSMASTIDDAIGGFNTFLTEQKAVPGEARMTVTIFDDQFDTLYQAKPIAEADALTKQTFVPRGGTALLDAIGRTLSAQQARIKGDGWAEKTIVCILTDGGENQSREFTRDMIKERITAAEKDGWSFIFLAANQDAFASGASMGINAAHTMSYVATGVGTRAAYTNMSATATSLRSAPANKKAA